MITQANWRKYIDRLAAIDKKAADLMQAYIDEHGLQDTEALIQYAYSLVTKYGETSATLASEMYDYMAELMNAGVPEAIPAETAMLKEIAKGVTWGKYHSPSQIPSVVSRLVRQAGADTMIQNAKRDKAQWAWVPQGDTCPFCIMLASNGWQKASKTVLRGNHAEHVHQNCDCTFAIAFKERDKRQYDYIYDHKKYLDMYTETGGDINEMRRRIYAKNKGAKFAGDNGNNQSKKQLDAKPYKDVLKEYRNYSTPGRGTIDYSKDYNKNDYPSEVNIAQLIHKEMGGEIVLLSQKNRGKGLYNPDYLWNDELWDLKNCSTSKALDSAVRKGLLQIADNPGGIIVELNDDVNLEDAINTATKRVMRKDTCVTMSTCDIMFIQHKKIVRILRYVK